MHALRNLHVALAPDGLLVDTQPISPHAPVRSEGRLLGELDMRAWVEELRAVDERFDEVIAAGLFSVEHEEHFVVVDAFDTGPECLETVSDWSGTRVSPTLASQLESTPSHVTVDEQVRLRLLRRSDQRR